VKKNQEAWGFFSELSVGDRVALKNSRAERYRKENELAMVKLAREIEVLKANDVGEEVKRYRTKVSAAIERNMVSMEKTHAMLKATGNVPAIGGGGFAETVVSGNDCPSLSKSAESPKDGSISPDSSVSQAEIRMMQKENLDNKATIEKLRSYVRKMGASPDHFEKYSKRTWTDNSENHEILDDMYPDGIAMDFNDAPEGKFFLLV